MREAPLLLLRVATLPFEALSPLQGARSTPLLEALAVCERALAEAARGLEEALHLAAGDRESASDPEEARARVAVLRLRRDVHHGRPCRTGDLERAVPEECDTHAAVHCFELA